MLLKVFKGYSYLAWSAVITFMALKNFSFRLLLPIELHDTYKRVVNDKAKQNAFISHLRMAFSKLLADAVMSQGSAGGDMSKAQEQEIGNITSAIGTDRVASLKIDFSQLDRTIAGKKPATSLSLSQSSGMMVTSEEPIEES